LIYAILTLADSKVGDEWPLAETVEATLKANQSKLVKLLRIDQKTLTPLFHSGSITEAQINHVCSKQTPEKRNRAMLEIVQRFSMHDYRQLVDCLKQNGKNAAAVKLLEHAEGKTLPN